MAELAAIADRPQKQQFEAEHDARIGRKDALDGATPDRILKAGGHFDTAATGVQRVTEAPFDWMAHRRLITFRQHEAGERFRNTALIARSEPAPGSVDWNSSASAGFGPTTPSMFTAQAIADARSPHRAAVAAVGPRLEPILDQVLIRESSLERAGLVVCGYIDRRTAIGAAAALLRVALDVVGDHYRLRENRPKRSVWRAPDMRLIDSGIRTFDRPHRRAQRQKQGSDS